MINEDAKQSKENGIMQAKKFHWRIAAEEYVDIFRDILD